MSVPDITSNILLRLSTSAELDYDCGNTGKTTALDLSKSVSSIASTDIDSVWFDSGTLTALNSTTISLSSLTDFAGNSFAFSSIYAILLKNTSTSAADLGMGIAAASPFQIGSTQLVPAPFGGALCVAAGSTGNGWSSIDGFNLRIVETANYAALYDIFILGNKA